MHAPTHPAIALDEPTDPEPSTARRPEPVGRDWIDTAIEWASGLAAVAMFAYGVALSYAVLHAVAAAADLPAWAARLWPLGFEAFMASAALNALAEQRHRRHLDGWWQRVPWYPWTLTGLTAGGSILLNWFHPAIPLSPPPGWLVSLVYGLPPLIAVFAWHLFLQRVAHRRHPAHAAAGTVPPVPQPAGPDPHQDGDREAGTAAAGGPARVGVGGRVGRRAGVAGVGAGPTRPRPVVPRPTTGTAAARDGGLLTLARAAAAEFDNTHGRPISRDALRQALRVSNQTAGRLLRELRADQADPDSQPQDQDDGVAARAGLAGAPEPTGPSQGPERGPAGNGAGGRPAGLAALVPTVPVPRPTEDGQEVAGDA
jgi:hypothetical protein